VRPAGGVGHPYPLVGRHVDDAAPVGDRPVRQRAGEALEDRRARDRRDREAGAPVQHVQVGGGEHRAGPVGELQRLHPATQAVQRHAEPGGRRGAVAEDRDGRAVRAGSGRAFQHAHPVSRGDQAARERQPTDARSGDDDVHLPTTIHNRCCTTHVGI
jgi:hypothetical protein